MTEKEIQKIKFSEKWEQIKNFLNDYANLMEENVQSLERFKAYEDNSESQQELNDKIGEIKSLVDNWEVNLEADKEKQERENQAETEIQAELEKIKELKLKNVTDEELSDLLAKFKGIKKWITTGNQGQQNAALSKLSELKNIIGKLGLENYQRECIKTIEGTLTISKLENTDLEKEEYIEFATTLRKKKTRDEIDEFENKIISFIGEQKGKYLPLLEVLSEGRKAVENRDIKQAEDVLTWLEVLKKITKEAYYNRIREVNTVVNMIERLKRELGQTAQITQNPL